MNDLEKKELTEKAIEVAKRILAGETDPNEGCSQLGDINRALDWPKELSVFGLLSHEQYDHEDLYITPENCVPDIIDECKKLVANNS